jgi:hypothetical protein
MEPKSCYETLVWSPVERARSCPAGIIAVQTTLDNLFGPFNLPSITHLSHHCLPHLYHGQQLPPLLCSCPAMLFPRFLLPAHSVSGDCSHRQLRVLPFALPQSTFAGFESSTACLRLRRAAGWALQLLWSSCVSDRAMALSHRSVK